MTTTAEIRERLKNAIVHELKKADSSFEEDELEKSVEDALSIALSGEFKLLYKGIEEAAKQGCPKTATSKDDSTNGQGENLGVVKLKRLPTPAVPGEYTITITGTGTVSAGTQYVDNETDFVGIAENVNQNFTLFKADGTPLRLELEIIFKEYRTLEEQISELQSYTRTRSIKQGDTLSRIAYEEYNDPAQWRTIAQANKITDPRALTPGQVIQVPPLTSLEGGGR